MYRNKLPNNKLTMEEKESLLKSLVVHNLGIKVNIETGYRELDMFSAVLEDDAADLLFRYMHNKQ